jgi:glycosyltransferase involved in cell wall biosynthesis
LIAGKPLSQDGAYQQSLLKLAQDLGIEKYINFLGHIADPISIYQSSDVSVLPCVWSEPCPRSIIESMACGTPVVASKIGGIPEILTGEFQNLLFEPKNAQKLAEALKFVFKWKDIDAQLSVKCQQHISCNFNLDIMMNGVENIFLKLLN